VEGFVRLALCTDAVGQEINIATQQELSIGDLAREIIALMGIDARVAGYEQRLRPKKSEVERLSGNNSKLFKLTGWKPSTSLDDGLRATIEWFSIKSNLTLYMAHLYNV
jgi:nucleoside-diphosphate-sugar epimerase